MDLGYAGRVAVVTGGSSGIGLAAARLLLAEGARVAICGRDAARLDAARDGLAGGERLLAMRCDVLDRDAVARFADAVAEWGGRRARPAGEQCRAGARVHLRRDLRRGLAAGAGPEVLQPDPAGPRLPPAAGAVGRAGDRRREFAAGPTSRSRTWSARALRGPACRAC
jgi:NAD(P)-dependent dehydrogenase (short-subunit alcohol dehydrogenase family)